MKHIVSLSGGKDSTALALRLAECEPREYIYLTTLTGNELPAVSAHLSRIETLLGVEILHLSPIPGDGLLSLIESYRALPNHRQRWCTRQLKIEPALYYMAANAPCINYVGLRADEEGRGGIYGDIPGVQQRFPLREWGWGVVDVLSYLKSREVCVPPRTDCAWCYGQRLIEWKRLLLNHQEKYAEAEELERKIGKTFRSPNRDTWPAGLAELRAEFTAGRKVRGEDGVGEDRCRACTM